MNVPFTSRRRFLQWLAAGSGAGLLAACAPAGGAPAAKPAPAGSTPTRDQVLAAAKQEGTVGLYAGSTLGAQGAEALQDAFNQKHGLNVTVSYYPSGSMTTDVGKLVNEMVSGVAPTWDVMVLPASVHATLWLRKLYEYFDYAALGVDPKMVHYDQGTVAFANQFILPAYNKDVLPAQDVPKSWDELLDPKWRGGKLGLPIGTSYFAFLAIGPWGEQKTADYVRALAQQGLNVGPPGAVYSRLLLGEVLVAVTLPDTQLYQAKKTGAPIVHAEIEPLITAEYHAGVLKGCPHPNLGHLFAAFLTTPEAQQTWERFTDQTSALVPGTRAYQYVQGKQVAQMADQDAEAIHRIADEHGKIFGYS
jgi:iron(III) transport system substrate-binding protein